MLFVVLMHAEYYFFSQDIDWFTGGFLGVDLFFVLSGYLITNILLESFQRHGQLHYGAFYRNRALRLLPALAVLLTIFYSYTRFIDQSHLLEIEPLIAIVFYYFNWFIVSTLQSPEGMGHMWSLAVEEQFYLLWPVLLALLLKNGVRFHLLALTIAGMVITVATWRAHLWHGDTNWLFLYVRTDTRIDSILTGAGLAVLLFGRQLHLPHIRFLSPLSGLTLLISMFYFDREMDFLYMGGFTLIAILASVLIYHAVQQGRESRLYFDWAPLRYLGKISYGLYLWHMPIFNLVSRYSGFTSALWQSLIAIALLFVVTLLSWHLVERPLLRLKKRA